ncbi:hypothetical protein NP233_g8029 [Leucocoprinus birnbaumii]|uniref:F-box domain-containing protein n=1 Tax=Leucocoprinus birnbaumii TaxID=56174 RepID=A0AAD5VPP1_9AGAR|nr:hypothetical protein NP233_g8029 [Leucocoprinus birnbaumii]
MASEQPLPYYVCDDILEEIAAYLPLDDKKALSLVRHSAREILQPSLFRVVRFDIPEERNLTADHLKRLESEIAFFATPCIASAVRACQVTLFNEPGNSSLLRASCILDRIFELLASFHRLEQLALFGINISPRHWTIISGLDRLEQLLCSSCTHAGNAEIPKLSRSLRLFSMNPPYSSNDQSSFDWVPQIPENIQSLELHNQSPSMVQYFTQNASIYSHLTSLHYNVTQDEFDAYTPFLLSLLQNFPSLRELSLDSSSVYLPKLEPEVIDVESHLPSLALYKGPSDLLTKLVGDGSPIKHILPRYPEYTSTEMVMESFSCEQLALVESLQLKVFHIRNIIPVVENFKGLQALALSMDYYDVPSYSTCRDVLASIRETVRQMNTPIKYLWLHVTAPRTKTYRGEQRLQRDAFLNFCLDVFGQLEYVSVSEDRNWRKNKLTGKFEETGEDIFFDDWRRARQGHLTWNYQRSICFNTY